MNKKHTLLATLPILALSTAISNAAIFVYEGFNYSNVGDDLDNVTSVDVAPTGLTGGWTENKNNVEMFIKSGNLNFSNLDSSGNHIGYLSNSSDDAFTQSLDAGAISEITNAGVANDTIYFSFLFEKLQDNFGAAHEGLALMNVVLPDARWDSGNPGAVGRHGFAVAAVNNRDLQAVFYDGTLGTRTVSGFSLDVDSTSGPNHINNTNKSGSNLTATSVKMIVAEISFNTGSGGNDVFSLYSVTDDGDLGVDDLNLLGSINADIDESTLNTLNITRQVNVNYDEIRFANTALEALGIPEPSTGLLALIGATFLLRRRRDQ